MEWKAKRKKKKPRRVDGVYKIAHYLMDYGDSISYKFKYYDERNRVQIGQFEKKNEAGSISRWWEKKKRNGKELSPLKPLNRIGDASKGTQIRSSTWNW